MNIPTLHLIETLQRRPARPVAAPRSHVVDVRPSPPRIYDWSLEPDVDDYPPHGIERVDVDGWLRTELG